MLWGQPTFARFPAFSRARSRLSTAWATANGLLRKTAKDALIALSPAVIERVAFGSKPMFSKVSPMATIEDGHHRSVEISLPGQRSARGGLPTLTFRHGRPGCARTGRLCPAVAWARYPPFWAVTVTCRRGLAIHRSLRSACQQSLSQCPQPRARVSGVRGRPLRGLASDEQTANHPMR